MKQSILEKIANRIKYHANRMKNLDWGNPRIILIACAVVIFPFAAWYYISTGLVLGLLKAISILWILEKSPMYIKELVVEYPMASDIILNLLMLMLIGGYFGAGLTLGLGAIFSMVFISWALPSFADKVRKEKQHEEPSVVL